MKRHLWIAILCFTLLAGCGASTTIRTTPSIIVAWIGTSIAFLRYLRNSGQPSRFETAMLVSVVSAGIALSLTGEIVLLSRAVYGILDALEIIIKRLPPP